MPTKQFLIPALVTVLAMAGCAAESGEVGVAGAESALSVFWVDGANEVSAEVDVVGPQCNGTQGELALSGTFTALQPGTIWLIMTLDGPPPASETVIVVDAEFVPAGRDYLAVFDELLPVPDGLHAIDLCFALDDGTGAPSTSQGCLSTISSNLACATPIDTTPPMIAGSRSPAANASGWNNEDVTVSFACDDAESGITSCTAPVTVSSEGVNQSVTGTAVNGVGLSASATVSDINIDKTAPSVSFSGTGSYDASETVNVTCSAADTLSGVASSTCADVSGDAYSFGVGSHEVTASATDHADNVGSGQGSFTVTVSTTGLCTLFGRFSSDARLTATACSKLAGIQSALDAGDLRTARRRISSFRSWLLTKGMKALSASELQIMLELLDALAQQVG